MPIGCYSDHHHLHLELTCSRDSKLPTKKTFQRIRAMYTSVTSLYVGMPPAVYRVLAEVFADTIDKLTLGDCPVDFLPLLTWFSGLSSLTLNEYNPLTCPPLPMKAGSKLTLVGSQASLLPAASIGLASQLYVSQFSHLTELQLRAPMEEVYVNWCSSLHRAVIAASSVSFVMCDSLTAVELLLPVGSLEIHQSPNVNSITLSAGVEELARIDITTCAPEMNINLSTGTVYSYVFFPRHFPVPEVAMSFPRHPSLPCTKYHNVMEQRCATVLSRRSLLAVVLSHRRQRRRNLPLELWNLIFKEHFQFPG